MKSRIEQLKPLYLFFLLSFVFFVFYLIQIPFWTRYADVLVHSCRSLSDFPILNYAFLDERSLFLHGTKALPNYHLGHTVLLWLIYHIVPHSLAVTIWPSGFLASICGSLVVGFTFLIWLHLGLQKYISFIIAMVVGLIPSIWCMSLIGAVYSLQLLSIVLFLYFFLRNHIFLSSLTFLFANLVSPLSALSFPLLFLKSQDKETLRTAFYIGFFALLAYFLVYYLINSNVLLTFKIASMGYAKRSIFWNFSKFGIVLILNINFLLIFLVSGSGLAWQKHRNLVYGLLPAFMFQLSLPFYKSGFLSIINPYLLLLFWILSFPTGLALAQYDKIRSSIVLAFVGLFVLTQLVCMIPNKHIGVALNEAGKQLRSQAPAEIKIVGNWNSTIAVVIGKYGPDFEKISSKYIEFTFPSEADLLRTGENSLIVVISKRPYWRKELSKLPISMFKIKDKNFSEQNFCGSIQLIFENDAVYIYKWDRMLSQSVGVNKFSQFNIMG